MLILVRRSTSNWIQVHVHASLKPVKALVCCSSCLLKYIKRLVSFIFLQSKVWDPGQATTIDSINDFIILKLNPLVAILHSSIQYSKFYTIQYSKFTNSITTTKYFPISMNYWEVFYGQKFKTHFAQRNGYFSLILPITSANRLNFHTIHSLIFKHTTSLWKKNFTSVLILFFVIKVKPSVVFFNSWPF